MVGDGEMQDGNLTSTSHKSQSLMGPHPTRTWHVGFMAPKQKYKEYWKIEWPILYTCMLRNFGADFDRE